MSPLAYRGAGGQLYCGLVKGTNLQDELGSVLWVGRRIRMRDARLDASVARSISALFATCRRVTDRVLSCL